MERAVPMQTQNSMAQVKPDRQSLQHRDANPLVSVVVVLGFLAVVWGGILISSYFEHGRSAKVHSAGKVLPPIFVRQ